MANRLYDKAREGFLDGDISWSTDTIRAVLVNTNLYTADFANDEFLDDIPSGARVATSDPLTGKTSVAGVADASDPTLIGVTGPEFEAVVFFQDTGVEATSRLINYWDTAVGLPYTPTGGNVTLTFDDGPNKIFKL